MLSETVEYTDQSRHKQQQLGQTAVESHRPSDEDLPLLHSHDEAALLAQSADHSQESSCFSWSRPWQLELIQIFRLSAPATIQVGIAQGLCFWLHVPDTMISDSSTATWMIISNSGIPFILSEVTHAPRIRHPPSSLHSSESGSTHAFVSGLAISIIPVCIGLLYLVRCVPTERLLSWWYPISNVGLQQHARQPRSCYSEALPFEISTLAGKLL